MNWLIVLPILIPIITAVLAFFSWHRITLQRWLTAIGSFCLVIASLFLLICVSRHHYLIMQVGNWPAPFGITLIADMLSSLMIFVTSIIGFCVLLFSFTNISKRLTRKGYYPAYCILFTGLAGAFLTGDLFNLYVWFEVILIASFVLLSLGEERLQLEGTVKYAVLNLIATLILLTAIAFIYGISGTLNMADIASFITHSTNTGLITTIAVIFIVSLGIKGALFPLFFWLPASYHTTSYSTSAIFSGVLSKVGVYALIRLFTLMFLKNSDYLHSLLLILANFTLVIGILGAIAQVELRRILSFTLISHIGYMIVGLALFTPLALIGSIFYMLQHMLVKTNLFLCSGYIHRQKKSTSLIKVKDLYREYPYFSILFFISAFALAGMPPLSGFWGKIILIKASFLSHEYATMVILAAVGLLTIFVMARIWQNMFLMPNHQSNSTISIEQTLLDKIFLILPITLLTIIILLISFFPNELYSLASIAAHQLLNPQNYIHAVMKGT